MKLPILTVIMFAIYLSYGQTPIKKVLYSDNGLALHQSLKTSDNLLANWYYRDFEVFFGTTTLDSDPQTSFAFSNNSGYILNPVKGLTGTTDRYYTLLDYYIPGNNKNSTLICHNATGSFFWQKNFSSPSFNGMTSGDMCFVNDSTLAILTKSENTLDNAVYLLDIDGNLLQSFTINATKVNQIERNNDSTLWCLGSFYNSTNELFTRICLFDLGGNKLKEFSIDNYICTSSVSTEGTIKFILNDLNNQNTLVNMDTTGILNQPLSNWGDSYSTCFPDLIPFNQHYAQIQHQDFQEGHVNFFGSNYISVFDYVQTTGFVVLDSSIARIYSKGPFYGIKKSLNFAQPHIGICTIDSSFQLIEYCFLNTNLETSNATSIVANVTDSSFITLEGSIGFGNFTSSPITVYDSISCIDAYGSVATNENEPLEIYPNPTDQFLHINSNEVMVYSYEIIESNGRLIATKSSQTPIDFIDFSTIDNGVYFLRTIDNSGKNHLNKVVKK